MNTIQLAFSTNLCYPLGSLNNCLEVGFSHFFIISKI